MGYVSHSATPAAIGFNRPLTLMALTMEFDL
jgi:hypothetical protein